MKEFFARLNSTERRFVIAVMIVIFFVINLLFVWPRFKDWDEMKGRLAKANKTLDDRKAVVDKSEALQPKLKEIEKQDAFVPPEDQENEFNRAITTEAAESGVNITVSTTIRQTATTNQFFSERAQAVTVVADEPQLVNFLYGLGAGSSMIRVRDLALSTDAPRFKLQANLKLVASFQKRAAVRTATTNAPAAKTVPAAKTTPAPPATTTIKSNPPARTPPPLPKTSTKK